MHAFRVVLAGVVLGSAPSPVAMAETFTIRPDGGPFVVNELRAGSQGPPSVSGAGGGQAVVAWQGPSSAGKASGGIWTRVIRRGGGHEPEQLLSTNLVAYPTYRPKIAGNASQGWMVVWDTFADADGDQDGVFGRMLDPDALPLGDAAFGVTVATQDIQYFSDVSVSGDGSYLAHWTYLIDPDGPANEEFQETGRIFHANGTARTGEFEISPGRDDVSTAGLPGDKFVAAFDRRLHYLDATGDVFDDRYLDSGDFNNPHAYRVAACDDGRHVVVFGDIHDSGAIETIYAQWVGSDRQPAGDFFAVATDRPVLHSELDVETTTDCDALVTWAEAAVDDEAIRLHARVIGADSSLLSDVFEFPGSAMPSWRPVAGRGQVSFDSASSFLATWSFLPADAEASDIAAQWFCLQSDTTAVCGDATCAGDAEAQSDAERVRVSDALATLRAAVAIDSCAPCRCDVDASGAVSVLDAARILRKVSGTPVTLDCPAC